MKIFTSAMVPAIFWTIFVVQTYQFNEMALHIFVFTILTACLAGVGNEIGKHLE
jgi:hypothetical protein